MLESVYTFLVWIFICHLCHFVSPCLYFKLEIAAVKIFQRRKFIIFIFFFFPVLLLYL
ncbi:hypothetical protein C1646_693652 [Rhizophagus diaphanus]|nr:hypothetical protein C1646_693652 [Rhizophagus diaphanus] [Rhizophagus sp. MUCL 43196]